MSEGGYYATYFAAPPPKEKESKWTPSNTWKFTSGIRIGQAISRSHPILWAAEEGHTLINFWKVDEETFQKLDKVLTQKKSAEVKA